MKKRDYGSYLEDIIEHMNYAEEFIRDMTFDEFKSDKKTVLSVTKCIEVVGEATKHIPDQIREGSSLFCMGELESQILCVSVSLW